jgi:hypothetical protein
MVQVPAAGFYNGQTPPLGAQRSLRLAFGSLPNLLCQLFNILRAFEYRYAQ